MTEAAITKPGAEAEKLEVQAQAVDPKVVTMEEAENKEDMEIFNEIARGLEGEKQECFPGAPAILGVSFVKINNWEQNCGFNPLFYVFLFLVIGLITLAISYSSDSPYPGQV